MDELNDCLSIAAVERDTGLGKDTLRVWERRYGFPQPLRDAFGDRRYPPAQVEKLRLIKRLMDQGWRPGRLFAVDDAELARLASQAPETGEASEVVQSEWLDLLRPAQREGLRRRLQQQLSKNGMQRFVVDTISPLNRLIGEAWMRGELQVTDEHLYSELLQNLLRGAIHAQDNGEGRPRVLLTTLPDELHVLGLLMVEAMLAPEGVACVSLGAQTPVPDIVNAVRDGGFDILALSFSAAFSARAALAGLSELRRRLPPEVALWAGGTGVPERAATLDGVLVISDIAQVCPALETWRARNAH